jgi:hypothetical protein
MWKRLFVLGPVVLALGVLANAQASFDAAQDRPFDAAQGRR